MQRRSDSHKGENGKVAIIGGSERMHGAPIFSALACEATGVDLIYVCTPRCHLDVTKQASYNLQVHGFSEDEISTNDIEDILELLAVMDCAIIGPGLRQSDETEEVIKEIVHGAACPLVLDAMALHPFILDTIHQSTVIATPHLGELERMGISDSDLSEAAQKANIAILLKGAVDQLALSDGSQQAITGGNSGLTVGGTGDCLAGIIAGLVAQGASEEDACLIAANTMKRAGETLYDEKGYAYTTSDIIQIIPYIIEDL